MVYRFILISYIVIAGIASTISSFNRTNQKANNKNDMNKHQMTQNNSDEENENFLLLLLIPFFFFLVIIIILIFIWRRDKIPSQDKEALAKMKNVINKVRKSSIELETLCYLCLEKINTSNEESSMAILQEEQKTMPLIMLNEDKRTTSKRTRLPCGHSYHCSCFTNWKQIKEINTINLDLDDNNNSVINICPRCYDGKLNNENEVSSIKNNIVKIQLQMHPSLSQMFFIDETKEND